MASPSQGFLGEGSKCNLKPLSGASRHSLLLGKESPFSNHSPMPSLVHVEDRGLPLAWEPKPRPLRE